MDMDMTIRTVSDIFYINIEHTCERTMKGFLRKQGRRKVKTSCERCCGVCHNLIVKYFCNILLQRLASQKTLLAKAVKKTTKRVMSASRWTAVYRVPPQKQNDNLSRQLFRSKWSRACVNLVCKQQQKSMEIMLLKLYAGVVVVVVCLLMQQRSHYTEQVLFDVLVKLTQ